MLSARLPRAGVSDEHADTGHMCDRRAYPEKRYKSRTKMKRGDARVSIEAQARADKNAHALTSRRRHLNARFISASRSYMASIHLSEMRRLRCGTKQCIGGADAEGGERAVREAALGGTRGRRARALGQSSAYLAAGQVGDQAEESSRHANGGRDDAAET